MIPDLKPYAPMKDSGVPWLGDVPEHWKMERGKWLFRKKVRPVRDLDDVVTCFRDGIVTLRKNRRVSGFTESLKEIGYQGIRRGDLVIHAMDAFAGAIGVADSDGKGTPVYLVCKPGPNANAYYFAYAIREMARSQWIHALAKGIRERSTDFRFESFGAQPLPLPPQTEQAAIVRFLDYADRRIRRYIGAKQKLIMLLEEQKQAIVHQAVTRGLDPSVRLKPSGVEWLGDVPEHWDVLPARYIFRAVTRRDIRGDETKLSVTQRHGLVPTDQMEEKSTQASSFDRFQICQPGDLVLNKYKAHLGVFWAAHSRGLITPNYTVFRPLRSLNTSYFQLLFHTRAYRDAFGMIVYGVTEGMSPLYTHDFYSIPTCVPPRIEQEFIVSWVAEHSTKENAAISRVEREIVLLHEYRTRLVADVVTGKLDVREAAEQLPDELEPVNQGVIDPETDNVFQDDLDSVLEEAEA